MGDLECDGKCLRLQGPSTLLPFSFSFATPVMRLFGVMILKIDDLVGCFSGWRVAVLEFRKKRTFREKIECQMMWGYNSHKTIWSNDTKNR